jgi:hypothetical protein
MFSMEHMCGMNIDLSSWCPTPPFPFSTITPKRGHQAIYLSPAGHDYRGGILEITREAKGL